MSFSGSGETGSADASSVPTDLTVTSEGDGGDVRHYRRHARDIHSLTAEKAQLQQVIEKLRLELQGRDAQLLALKAQCRSITDQRVSHDQAKLSERQAKINRLEAELLASNNELKLLKERAAKELAHLLQKCLEFQQNQSMLMVKHEEVKSTLNTLHLPEEEFLRLRNIPQEHLNLQQHVSVRVYEMVTPLKIKVKELEAIKSRMESMLGMCENELEVKRKENIARDHEIGNLKENIIEYTAQCDELRKQLKEDDYKIRNFSRIKKERDQFEEERNMIFKEKSDLEVSSGIYKKEKLILEERLSELKNKLRHLEQELSKYRNNYYDAKSHLDKGKENVQKTHTRLRLEQERSEEIQDKFFKARAEVISLQEDLRDSENKIKSIQEQNVNSNINEKEIGKKLDDVTRKYEALSRDMESLQTKYLKETDYFKLEVNELKASYKSVSKSYNSLLEDNTRLHQENRAFMMNLEQVKSLKEKEMLELRAEIEKSRHKLDQYKNLEEDYISTLKVFASAPEQSKNIDGSLIPASSIVKGKLSEETITLTRRILHLERQNVQACTTIQRLTAALDQMRSNLSSYKAAISMAGKPSSQFLERISSQEEQIFALENALAAANESKQFLFSELNVLDSSLKKVLSELEDTKIQEDEVRDLQRELVNLQKWISRNVGNRDDTIKVSALPTAIKIEKGNRLR